MTARAALLWFSLLYMLPAITFASLCNDNHALMQVAEEDRVSSDYFDAYFISMHRGVYHIQAKKQVALDFTTLKEVMEAHEDHPEFMPGYRRVKVVRNSDGELLTGLKFRTSFSPFTSHFTTVVETTDSNQEYQQCWRQLEEDDPRVIEEYSMAPKTNQGLWSLRKLEDGIVEVNYFSMIKPPVPIPSFLYKRIVKDSYRDVFKQIIRRTRSLK